MLMYVQQSSFVRNNWAGLSLMPERKDNSCWTPQPISTCRQPAVKPLALDQHLQQRMESPKTGPIGQLIRPSIHQELPKPVGLWLAFRTPSQGLHSAAPLLLFCLLTGILL